MADATISAAPTSANAPVPTQPVAATPEPAATNGDAAKDSKPSDDPTSPAAAPESESHSSAQPTSTEAEPTKVLTAAAPEPGATPTVPAAPSTASAEVPAAPLAPEPTPAAVPQADGQSAPPTVAPAAPISTTSTTTSPTIEPSSASAPKAQLEAAEKEEAEGSEPQNTLTKKFTEAEWAALKKFRAELPQIFADGFPDDPKAKDKPITFWGVPIDPNHPKDARVSVILMKFLRARNLDVSEARDMLVSTFRWRTSIDIDAVMKEEFPDDVFGNVGRTFGRDKEGRPVVYNIYGGNDLSKVFSDVQRFIRWRVALQEKSVAMLDFNEIDQTVQIHDYLGVSLASRDAKSKAAASEATNIFQSHYPELLHRKFFVNVPTIMNWIFWVFKPLIPAATLAKMSVVGAGHHTLRKALLPIIDAKELPTKYGGEAEGF
ncbi:putative CRAL TRIO domain-containing protein [Lyophyllum shimeji]|uniref:Phosphatidylinositol transfer protein SFH5 n=1 Tax=Lyophyllum shimeji TaxID=47721 RepID=A0A9P3PTP6_LYOSH|nr:putative CRAL TRIO domain-containing protein [Lyophyllum shimeji]